MKAWRLLHNDKTLEILQIDEKTREVVRVTTLRLTTRLTKPEAAKYMDEHFPELVPAR